MNRDNSLTQVGIETDVTTVSSALVNQVLNDHPDVQTIVPPYDYDDIQINFPRDIWLQPSDLTVNGTWTDTGANPSATMTWGTAKLSGVTTKDSYPAVVIQTTNPDPVQINLGSNAVNPQLESFTYIVHIENLTPNTGSVRVTGVTQGSLYPNCDDLFNNQPLFNFVNGATLSSYYFNGVGKIEPVPVSPTPLITPEGTSTIVRWNHTTSEYTVADCATGSLVTVARPLWLGTISDAVFFGSNITPGDVGMRFTDFSYWKSALTDIEIKNLQSAYCSRYTTTGMGPQDRQVLAFSNISVLWEPKSLDPSYITGFNLSVQTATQYSQSNYSAVVNPTNADSANAGYGVGSIWLNISTDEAFTCTRADEPAGAVWRSVTTPANIWTFSGPSNTTPGSGDYGVFNDLFQGTSRLFINKLDGNGVDQTAFLDTKTGGATITFTQGGINSVMTVTLFSIQPNHYELDSQYVSGATNATAGVWVIS